ncbi:hypothetical protein KQH40_01000 [bacterium]|nr:hypothetical protein [bacterium]
MINDGKKKSSLQLSGSQETPRPLSEQVDRIDKRLAALPAALFFTIPTGFPALDDAFGGGLVAQDLMLIAGKQNVGKTIMALQIARNIAKWAQENHYPLVPWVVSYEHDDWDLLTRLICMESLLQLEKEENSEENLTPYFLINKTIRKIKEEGNGQPKTPENFLDMLFDRLPPVALRGFMAISKYMPNLMLSLGDRTHTTVQSMEEVMAHYKENYGLYIIPIIDYLQTIPPPISLVQQAISNPDIVNARNIGLVKDLAMRYFVPVIAVAAIEDEALKAQRPVHIEDVFGPIQAQYTPDRVIILNPDVIIADPGSDSERVTTIRISLEKNRKGPSELEWVHDREGSSFYLAPHGDRVAVEDSFQQTRSRTKKGGKEKPSR